MKRFLPRNRQDVVGAAVLLLMVIGGLIALDARRPDPGTAKYIADHVKDPPEGCPYPDFGPLWNPELAAWRRRAQRSSNFACGTAGPVVQWAHFRSPADLDAALRAATGAPEYVCRAKVDLVRLIGFSRSTDAATCAALHGRRASRFSAPR